MIIETLIFHSENPEGMARSGLLEFCWFSKFILSVIKKTTTFGI